MRQKTKFVSSVTRGPRGTPESARKGWITRRRNLALKANGESNVVSLPTMPVESPVLARLKELREETIGEYEATRLQAAMLGGQAEMLQLRIQIIDGLLNELGN